MAVNSEPFVSIALLTYNRATTIGRSIESLLAQSHSNFELIINDDRSTDNTREVCLKYAAADSRVRYICNETNLRYAGNQTVAISRARSEYVAIVHDGDIYRADLLQRWVVALSQYPSAAIVFNDYEYCDSAYTQRLPFNGVVDGSRLFETMLLNECWWIFGIVMVRRSCIRAVGEFDGSIPTLADVDMWLRLLLRYDAVYVPESLLRIAPREAHHHNQPLNWSVHVQMDRIQWMNAARARPVGHADRDRVLRVIDFHCYRRTITVAGWALRKGNLRGAWGAVGHLLTFARRRAAAIAAVQDALPH